MDKMEDAKYLDLIAKYLSGNITGPERQVLFGWLEESQANQKFFDEMIQLWSLSNEYEEDPFEADVEAAWDRLSERLPGDEEADDRQAPAPQSGGSPSGKIRRLSIRRHWLRYAAVILLLVSIGGWWWFDPLEWRLVAVVTGAGEQEMIVLPDSSRVWLNERTTLTYRRPFWGRQVDLEGEAFFEVEKSRFRRFVIRAGEAQTTVLGTAFNVRAYPGEGQVKVTVKSGVVQLEDRQGASEEVMLLRGETGVFDKRTQEVTEKAVAEVNADAWKTRELSFQGRPLRGVIEDIEDYFNIDILVEVDELPADKPITAARPYTDPTLEQMNLLLSLEDLQLRRVDGKTYRLVRVGD